MPHHPALALPQTDRPHPVVEMLPGQATEIGKGEFVGLQQVGQPLVEIALARPLHGAGPRSA